MLMKLEKICKKSSENIPHNDSILLLVFPFYSSNYKIDSGRAQ